MRGREERGARKGGGGSRLLSNQNQSFHFQQFSEITQINCTQIESVTSRRHLLFSR